MNAKLWRRADSVFQSALLQPAEEQDRFVRKACGEDRVLEREVFSLLASFREAGSFLETGPLAIAGAGAAEPLIGTTVSHYRILEAIGGGGMGVVYKAEDIRLRRAVAVKFLAERLARDPEALARFGQEARAASRLNHPNICAVYDVGEQDGRTFIVLELLDGATLRHRMNSGPLPTDAVFALALEIASALQAAHAQGIIHRDIKPENIFVTSLGHAKLLDFGVAKLASSKTEETAGATVDWRTDGEEITRAGSVVGTLRYMSPEQVRGEALDTRTDVYSFGAVLNEMVAGVPEAVGALQPTIAKCLQRDRTSRYQHAAEIREQIEAARRGAQEERPRTRSVRVVRRWALIGSAAALLGASAWLLARPLPPLRANGYLRVTQDGEQKGQSLGGIAARRSNLYVAEGSAYEPSSISLTNGEPFTMRVPFKGTEVLDLSRDGSKLLVANFTSGLGLWPLWSIPTSSGEPRRVGKVVATGAAWSPDGSEIAYVLNRELFRTADGGGARKLLTLPEPAYWLHWSPDGKRLRFTLGNVVDRTGPAHIWEAAADGTNLRQLLPAWNEPAGECCGSWSPDGRFYVFQASLGGKNEIWAIREQHRLADRLFHRAPEPVQITNGQLDSSAPAFSSDGSKVFVIGQQHRGELQRYDAASRQWAMFLGGVSAEFVSFSRDGKWVAYVTYPDSALWCRRTDGSDARQLTFPPMQSLAPDWAPDDEHIVFQSGIGGRFSEISMIARSGGKAEPLFGDGRSRVSPHYSPDGNSIVVTYPYWLEARKGVDLLDLKTRAVRQLPGSEQLFLAAWSPDGQHLVARRADHSAVMLFDVSTQRWEELAEGSLNWTAWSHDGRFVYYEKDKEHLIMRVRVSDKKVEQVADLKNFNRTGASGGFWFGLAPDDSVLMLHNTGTEEIYRLDWGER